MRAVFDTNILIDYLNGFQEAADEMELYEHRIISAITYLEVMVGAKSEEEEKIIESFLGTFEMREMDLSVTRASVALRKRLRLKVPDAIIYGTAKTEDAILITRDAKDLDPSSPDVRVPYRL